MTLSKILESKNKNLLITTVGKRSINTCKNWISNKKSFDVILIYYDREYVQGFEELPDVLIVRKGFKYPTLYGVFMQYPILLKKYNYFFLPDDDVEITSFEIESLFKFSQRNLVSICQPSIQPINYSWNITLNNPYTNYRFVSIVEVMCPLFSKEALNICLHTFNESQSGWGLEPAWKKLLNKDISKFAVFDKVIALHSKPINFQDGHLYNILKEKGINPHEELRKMCRKYNSRVEFINIYYNYKLNCHQNIYKYLLNLERSIHISDTKLICLLYLHIHLIKTVLIFFSKDEEVLFKFYSSNLNKKNINYFSSFFKKNKRKFKYVIRAISNSADQELKDVCMLKEWNLLCKNRINEIYELLINNKSKINYFMQEINFIMKSHLNLSDYFQDLLFYIICNLSNEIVDMDLKSDDL